MGRADVMCLFVVLAVGCTTAVPSSTNDQSADGTRPRSNVDRNTDIPTLLRTINDDAPITHFSYTPSALALVARGPEVIPHVLPLMTSDDEATRLRAKLVLSLVTMQMHGYVFGKGWTTPEDEDRFRAWWKQMGDLSEDADKERRVRAVELWTKWWESRRKV